MPTFRSPRTLALAAAMAVLATTPAAGQSFGMAAPPRTESVVTWSVRAERAAPGATARMVLHAEIAAGWRMYAFGSAVGRPLAVTVVGVPVGVQAGAPRQSDPHETLDPVLGVRYPYFSEEARVVIPLAVGRAVRAGRYAVTGAVEYAVCDDSICLAPARTRFEVPLVVR